MSMNITVPNGYIGSSDQWLPVWRLTRAMKAAGYKYLASSDGISGNGKETSANPVLDRWGPGGIVSGHSQLSSQTGSAAITAASPSSYYVTITGLTGMNANSVGHALTLSGSSSTLYNGTFTITGYVSATSVVIYNPNIGTSQAQETGLTWSERISGTASITWSAISNVREQTISGLSGMTTNSPGHYIKLEGSANGSNDGYFQILSYVSSSSVVIINYNAGAGADTASANWTELDPLLDVCPTNTTLMALTSWIVFQGPSTLRIPINAACTGTFIKGEVVTESGTGAQGELLGYQWESSLSLGYVIVMPRKDGSGPGVHGWATANSTLTGAASSATVTTANTHTTQEFVREISFARYTTSSNYGTINMQCVNNATENTSRFSYMAINAAGCTYAVYPGGGGTNNTFPTYGSFSVKYNSLWFSANTANVHGRYHIMVANPDYSISSAADGSFTLAVGNPAVNPGAFQGFGYYRLDNTEDGDVDPYVWMIPNSSSNYAEYRTGSVAGAPTSVTDHFSSYGQNNLTYWKGWRRRGFTTGDAFQQFTSATLSPTGSATTNLIYTYSADNDNVATALSVLTAPKVRDPIWIASGQSVVTIAGQAYGKMRKGTVRWAFIIAGGAACDTYDSKRWIQLSSANGSWVFGPWDGTSSPIQS